MFCSSGTENAWWQQTLTLSESLNCDVMENIGFPILAILPFNSTLK